MPFREQAVERRGPDAPIEVELGALSASQLYAGLDGAVVGVFASTFLVLERDVRVQVVITIPDHESIHAGGLVQFRRTAGDDQLPGLGIAFTRIAPEHVAVLAAFAERVRPPMLHDE